MPGISEMMKAKQGLVDDIPDIDAPGAIPKMDGAPADGAPIDTGMPDDLGNNKDMQVFMKMSSDELRDVADFLYELADQKEAKPTESGGAGPAKDTAAEDDYDDLADVGSKESSDDSSKKKE